MINKILLFRVKNFLKTTIQVMRLDDPRPCLFLIWPCYWGVLLGYVHSTVGKAIYVAGILSVVALLMYSAGCIVNDLIDMDVDRLVPRTKMRPLAAKKYKPAIAILLALFLCCMSIVILLWSSLVIFPKAVRYMQILIVIAACMIVIYPLTKRFTFMAQAFLGLTANLGVLAGSLMVCGWFGWSVSLVYIGASYWTRIYDSIYAYQDMKYDDAIGIKSAPVYYKQNLKRFLKTSAGIMFTCFIIAGLIDTVVMRVGYFVLLIFAFAIVWKYIQSVDLNSVKDCQRSLAINSTFIGGLITFAFFLGRIDP